MPLCCSLHIWPHISASGHSLVVHYKQHGWNKILFLSASTEHCLSLLVKLGKLLEDALGIKHGRVYFIYVLRPQIQKEELHNNYSNFPPPNPPLCWSNIQVGRKMGRRV